VAKILITGGAGFIGSHVAKLLLDQGHDVVVYDSFVHYVYPLEKAHIDNMARRVAMIQGRARLVRGHTHDQDYLRRVVAEAQPDYIIHLAAMPLANLAVEHPEEALQTIMTGTMNLLQSCRDLPNLKRFVYVSSSMVYGDFARVPVAEDDPKDPKEIYGSIKLAGELLTRAFSNLYGVQYAIVRPSAVYGPTDNNRRVLGIFCENALAGKTLTVKGANQALDFTFVSDIADGIVLATQHPGGGNQVFNMTRGRGRSIQEAAEIVARLVPGTKIEIVGSDTRLPSRGELDISRARSMLGYAPKVDLEDGLQHYLDHLRDQRQAGLW